MAPIYQTHFLNILTKSHILSKVIVMKLSLSIVSLVTLIVFLTNSPLILAENNGVAASSENSTASGHVSSATDILRGNPQSSSSSGNKESSSSDQLKGPSVSCSNKQAEVKTRMSNMNSYITKNESMLDAVTSRVENYYTTKFVPIGATISNYDSLVADISSKSAVLKAGVVLAQTDANSFNCNKNPKDQVKKFNTDIDTAKKDLRAYQKSIQTLIGALRALLPTTHVDNKEGSTSGQSSSSAKIK